MEMLLFFSVWVAAQGVLILYVRFIAWQQIPVLKVFREWVPRPNPYEKPMHRGNWAMAALIATVVACCQFIYGQWYHAAMLLALSVPLYSWLFDNWINKGLNNHKDYLGDGADTDKWLKKWLGNNAGQKKDMICIASVIILNVVSCLLFLF